MTEESRKRRFKCDVAGCENAYFRKHHLMRHYRARHIEIPKETGVKRSRLALEVLIEVSNKELCRLENKEEKARTLLNRVVSLNVSYAVNHLFPKMNHDFGFRQICLPIMFDDSISHLKNH